MRYILKQHDGFFSANKHSTWGQLRCRYGILSSIVSYILKKHGPFPFIATLNFRGDFPFVSIQGGAPYLSKLFLFDIND